MFNLFSNLHVKLIVSEKPSVIKDRIKSTFSVYLYACNDRYLCLKNFIAINYFLLPTTTTEIICIILKVALENVNKNVLITMVKTLICSPAQKNLFLLNTFKEYILMLCNEG